MLWLGAELLWGFMKYPFRAWLYPAPSALETRARWLQRTCSRLLRILNINVRTDGPIPGQGFHFSNHVSYVDILVIGSRTPCVFVAKHEVAGWPVFGWFASLAGTLFIDRARRSDVARTIQQMESVLNHNVLLVVFPEGTSSDGQTVLPFKTPLMEPAARSSHRISASWIGYRLTDGNVGSEVAYWGDMTMAPHLVNLLGKRGVDATLKFRKFEGRRTDRKELGATLHAMVMGMKNGSVLNENKQAGVQRKDKII